MRIRYIISFIILFCFAINANAQQVFIIKGVVSKGFTGQRVAQVLIKNLKTNEFIERDDLGWFSIKAAIGDTLQFTKKEFAVFKIAITNSSDLPVYLQPVILLNEVKIQGQSKRQEINDVMSQYKTQGTFYDGKPPVLSFLSSPITGLYELLGTTPGRARRFKADAKNELEYTEIHRRYNPALVKRVTNASDSVVTKFMEYYTPSIEDLKEWNDYQLIKHTREHYEYYDKNNNKEKLRQIALPPLVKPGTKRDTVILN